MENYINPIVIINIIAGLIFIIMGSIMFKFPPKKINYFYGYRTFRSTRSQERWDFAQIYSAKLLIKAGAFFFIIGLLGLCITIPISIGAILSFSLIFICAIFLIVKTERAIKKKFPL